ncbi:E3 ubiquitin-protein ligase Iruka-like [Actinia tenebrosa]|uniref:RING-type E3 ubiquitin transferase n=1 Tax=Actinia tenebrosa TaxID=6105 RepID=A0A6P8IQ83_ACTTE|nr:E3 ubiquitin-protein ligase Iruka-like [Actinia tenebrosa]
MAEGVVENPPSSRYFCHVCNREISPNLPEFTCPQCDNGFVEQMTGENNEDDNNTERIELDGSNPEEAFTQLWGRMFLGPHDSSEGSEGRRRRGLPRARRIAVRTSGQGGSSGNAAEAAAIDLFSILLQLLNQLEGTGPPPAENDKIEALPTIIIDQEQVDAKTECAVCQEQFHLSEGVKGLPCRHLYHKDCIEPWLKLHDSCPICRLSLSKNPTRLEQTD